MKYQSYELNKSHPSFQQLLASHEVYALDEAPNVDVEGLVEDALEQMPELTGAKLHVYSHPNSSDLVVFETEGGFFTFLLEFGGYLEEFSSLESAIEASFTDFYPETSPGDWNEVMTEFVEGGEWVLRK